MRRLLPLLVACAFLTADAAEAALPICSPGQTPAPPLAAGRSAAPAAPSPPATATPAPSRLARAEREPKRIPPPQGRAAAVKNPLYALRKAQAKCRVPAIKAGDWASTKKYMRAVAACMDRVWTRQFAQARLYYTLPPRRFVRHRVRDRDCGMMPAKGAAGTYCDETRIFYVIVERYEMHPSSAAYLAEVIAHEYGHHVQNMAYISDYAGEAYDEARSAAKEDLVSRRVELQAECLAGVSIGAMGRSMPAWAQFRYGYLGTLPGQWVRDHGRLGTQLRWLEKGYRSRRAGACDTWSPPRREVT
ncbi:neutral zinc metallopeptidase [Sphaerisporangium dianthi]|uniref:Neutral zinc metallopeptidase n=1 Tax=Sphaerisporangium dianthi TaxID=1436120 RepID=A0ABV9CKF6_9ACTN